MADVADISMALQVFPEPRSGIIDTIGSTLVHRDLTTLFL